MNHKIRADWRARSFRLLSIALLASIVLAGNRPFAAGILPTADSGSRLDRSTLPPADAADAARALLTRLLPRQATRFVVEIIPPDHGRDVFEIQSRAGKIVLRGNNAVSVASALNWYLQNECHCDLSWNCGDQMNLPKPLPAVPEKIRRVSPYLFRYAYNFCTYGYTTVWWDWPQWEHELDFLALHGFNLALAIEGQEAVWVNTFTRFGYSAADIRQWVVDPAHLPWFEMDNMESYGGPLSSRLVARRLALGQKIIARMRELGIAPVLPGYYGMVPPDFREKFPGANVHLQGNWAGLKRPDILDPTDPLFGRVAAAYYATENDLFGGANFYDADPFHEGGTTQNIDVPAAGRAIQRAMGNATWVLQSWQKNPRPEMLDALQKDKTLVLDLYCEDHENWRLRDNFHGAPWLWCAINCFGGNLRLGGRLAWMAEGPDRALRDPRRGRFSGIGALMEATGVNPVLWEMLLGDAWRTNTPDLQSWLADYTRRRYGAKIPAAEQAWNILAKSVYAEPPPSREYVVNPAVCSPPTLVQSQLPAEFIDHQARLVQAWKLLLTAAPQGKNSDGYRFDLADVTRQALADLSTRYNEEIVAAFKRRDAKQLRALSDKMLRLIRDMDELAGTRREWLLGVWLREARSWGTTPAEKNRLERNARELLTTWTRYDNIPDYANRQWNGLLGNFYFHRWQLWLDALNASLQNKTPFDETAVRKKIREWEINWTQETGSQFLTQPHGDVVAISQNLFAKYATEISESMTKDADL